MAFNCSHRRTLEKKKKKGGRGGEGVGLKEEKEEAWLQLTEIRDLNRAGLIEQYVLRFEIRMHDAFAVQIGNTWPA